MDPFEWKKHERCQAALAWKSHHNRQEPRDLRNITIPQSFLELNRIACSVSNGCSDKRQEGTGGYWPCAVQRGRSSFNSFTTHNVFGTMGRTMKDNRSWVQTS